MEPTTLMLLGVIGLCLFAIILLGHSWLDWKEKAQALSVSSEGLIYMVKTLQSELDARRNDFWEIEADLTHCREQLLECQSKLNPKKD